MQPHSLANAFRQISQEVKQ